MLVLVEHLARLIQMTWLLGKESTRVHQEHNTLLIYAQHTMILAYSVCAVSWHKQVQLVLFPAKLNSLKLSGGKE